MMDLNLSHTMHNEKCVGGGTPTLVGVYPWIDTPSMEAIQPPNET